MADISVIKLPNGSSYNLKDSQAIGSAIFSGHELTLVKRGSGTQVVDLGDFDTINVTDANIGNLVVTGSARFTNGIFGDLIGNATTAATASNVSGVAGSTNAARHVWFSDSGTETARNYDDDFMYNPSTNVLTVGSITGTATYTTTTADTTNALYPVGVTSGATTTLKRDTSITMTGGAISATSVAASSYVSVNSNSGTSGGLALYGTTPSSYGIAMRQTTNGGKHGYVQGDWAIYSYMSSGGTSTATLADNRGWVLRNTSDSENVASVSGAGHAVFNGSVTVGGNSTNTSGVELVVNTTTNSLDFVWK